MGDGYNGWANYETWNATLWIDNEYGWYKARLAADTSTPEACEAFAKETFGTTVTPDGAELSEVDWAEVCEHWNADD